MRSTIGLFAKVVLVGLIAVLMLQLLSPTEGVLKKIPKANATYKTDSAQNLVTEISNAERPSITGDTSKVTMKVGSPFNLLDLKQVGLTIGYQDGSAATYEVTEIYDQWDAKYDTTKASAFVPEKAGTYYVTYRAYRVYHGTTLEVTKQIRISAIE